MGNAANDIVYEYTVNRLVELREGGCHCFACFSSKRPSRDLFYGFMFRKKNLSNLLILGTPLFICHQQIFFNILNSQNRLSMAQKNSLHPSKKIPATVLLFLRQQACVASKSFHTRSGRFNLGSYIYISTDYRPDFSTPGHLKPVLKTF